MTNNAPKIPRDRMFYRFSAYGFLKNLRFFEPFILLIFRSYGLSFLQIGVLYSIRDIATNILEIPTGVLADSLGRRLAMVSAFTCYIVSFFLLYSFQTYWILVVSILFFACGEAFRSGTHKALIFEHLKIKGLSDLKVAYYGLTRSASQLGSALNALGAGILVFYSGGYRGVFLASIVPYTLDLINLASYPRELDGQITAIKGKAIWDRIMATLKGFFAIFRDAGQLKALLNSASFTAVFKTSKDYLQPVLAALALSITLFSGLEQTRREAVVIGVVYFVIYLLTSWASRQAYRVNDFFKDPQTAVNATYLGGVGLILCTGLTIFLDWHVWAVVFFIGMFLVNNIRRPINVGFISDQISSRIMASGLSAESLLTTIFAAGLAPLLGFVVDKFGLGTGISGLGLLMLALYLPVRVLKADPARG